MPAFYFGAAWDAPAFDEGERTQVPTPIGQHCLTCDEPIAVGDRGMLRGVTRQVSGELVGGVEPVHAECEMLGIIGHAFGVCRCTGWDTESRAAALELARVLEAERVRVGMGPLFPASA